jgi:threonine synthase
MLDDALLMARTEGLFAAPESGACVSAVRALLRGNFLKPEERIVILSTGSGLKYTEAFDTRFPRANASEYDKLGGLITPR